MIHLAILHLLPGYLIRLFTEIPPFLSFCNTQPKFLSYNIARKCSGKQIPFAPLLVQLLVLDFALPEHIC